MKAFIVFENATGKIVRYGTIQKENFDRQAIDGHTVIEGHPGGANYIKDGSPVFIPDPELTPEEIAAKDSNRKSLPNMIDIESRIRTLEQKVGIR